MRILFATTPHLPDVGGAQVTNHWLATALSKRAHEVIVFAPRPALAVRTAHSPRGPYRTLVSSDPVAELPPLITSLKPDWIVAGGHDERAARTALKHAAVKTLLYLHDLSATRLLRDGDLAADRVAAVSRWLAHRALGEGVRAVYLPPVVERARYRVKTTRRVALFVNPIPEKGVDIILALAAARPDVPFVLVPSWGLSPRGLDALQHRVRELDNVEVRKPCPPGGRLFADCRVLLVPSRLPEAWGRVASEAQMSGIPVIASSHGALPEAVGAGGILLAPTASVSAWEDALHQLWDDRGIYARYSALAEQQGLRTDLEPENVVRRFEAVLEG